MSSRATRIAIWVALTLFAFAVIAYAVSSTLRVQNNLKAAIETADRARSTQPFNTLAPPIVAQTLPPADGAPPHGTILYDMAHSEVFGPQDPSALGQSGAVERMRRGGYAVKVTTDKLERSMLSSDVAAIYLAGPMVPLMDKERLLINDFLARGGTMIITVHVPYPILGMPARYGLPVGTGVMVDPNVQTGDPGVWVTDRIVADPVTAGVKRLEVVSGWPVRTSKSDTAEPRLLAYAPKNVRVDANSNNRFDPADPQPPYGVVGVSAVGSGRVVVLGDDGIFANMAIDQYDNARLLDNLLDLISAPKPV